MIDRILSEIKNGAIDAITKKVGISRDKGLEICKEFLPEAMEQVKGITENPDKMSALMGKLMSGDYSTYLENNEENFDSAAEEDGKSILKILFDGFDLGEKTNDVAKKTTVEAPVIMKFLPLLATSLMGAVSKNAGEIMNSFGSGNNPLESLLGTDEDDKDASPIDSIAEMAGNFLKK